MTSPTALRCDASIGYESEGSDHAASALEQFVRAGIDSGSLALSLHPDSTGGTYMVVDKGGRPVAVFKPADEEVGQEHNPHGHDASDRTEAFEPGLSYQREVLAFALDHGNRAHVPETVLATINGRVGSLQRFVPECIEAGNLLPGRFSVADVHSIAMFDIRVLNCDRHAGNILARADRMSLVPIDHAYILPSAFSDPDFEWMMWPQSKEPFAPDELAYIRSLDADADAAKVSNVLGAEAGEIVAVTTRLLQRAAAAGKTVREIGAFCRRELLTQPSRLEALIASCRLGFDMGCALDIAAIDEALQKLFP